MLKNRRRLIASIALICVFAAGAMIGRSTLDSRDDVAIYRDTRANIVQQYLDEADPGFILIAGDSNAELHSTSGGLCGRTVVNVGISGATTQTYAKFFEELHFPVRPRAAVLTIGTNDLNRKKDPRGAKSSAGFETALDALIVRLRSTADTVFVTAVPPVGHDAEGYFDPLAVVAYSDRIKSACERLGCRFIDPFASLREGGSGYGLPGVNLNGRHLKRYKPVFSSIGASLCPDGHLQAH